MNFNLSKPVEKFLTKEDVLKHVTDLEVFQRYTNQEVKIKGTPVLSPLRTEKNPSFGYFIGENQEICFKDFKIGAGDCIKFVQLKFDLTYYQALSQIAIDFGFSDDYVCAKLKKTNFENNQTFLPREEIIQKNNVFSLQKTARKWKGHDLLYWGGYGITLETLNFYNVSPISYYFVNGIPFEADKYAYCFSEFKDGIETYKIYQPFNEKYKWINSHNHSIWSGWKQLPEKGDFLIITKSYKDIMCLKDVCGYVSTSLQAENVLPKINVINQLKERFKKIVILYDNDFDSSENWGQIFAQKLSFQFGIPSYCIDKYYKSKDPSSLYKKVGAEKTKQIINDLFTIPF